MTIMLTLYTLPSITALLIKLLIVLNLSYEELTKNKLVLAFFSSLFLLNLSEIGGFVLHEVGEGTLWALWWLRIYYALLVVLVALFALLCIAMAVNLSKPAKALFTGLSTVVGAISLTPLIVADTQSIGYQITRVEGNAYHLFTVFVFLCVGLSLASLTLGLRNKTSILSYRCGAMLVATLPFALTIIIPLSLMVFDYKINVAGFISLATTIMLVTLIYTESKYHLFLMSSHLPWTKQYQYRKQLNLITRVGPSLYRTGIQAKELQRRFEETLINMAIEFTDGNQKQAAELLNLPPTTVWRKLKEYQQDS